jgi:hypothetical protein
MKLEELKKILDDLRSNGNEIEIIKMKASVFNKLIKPFSYDLEEVYDQFKLFDINIIVYEKMKSDIEIKVVNYKNIIFKA